MPRKKEKQPFYALKQLVIESRKAEAEDKFFVRRTAGEILFGCIINGSGKKITPKLAKNFDRFLTEVEEQVILFSKLEVELK